MSQDIDGMREITAPGHAGAGVQDEDAGTGEPVGARCLYIRGGWGSVVSISTMRCLPIN
ncbi:hypothetical protein M2163_003196 [Streptomyces sp. SAI-135]|nr:hypothetical protein [Streptomyces sp. SAI-090]MDH6616088.1 hypothetical protein [Streptomyces sp. SAI-135]